MGTYNDSRPDQVAPRLSLAREMGIDVFIYGAFWSGGKEVFTQALDQGFLGSQHNLRFALMWANRMPHRVLPIKISENQSIDPGRLVYSSPDDFTRMITTWAQRYFHLPNYWHLGGRPYLSIFDTTLFCRQLGASKAKSALAQARREVGDFHLAAIDPQPEWLPLLADIGFDSVTHYVLLPIWKGGPRLHDYENLTKQRSHEWLRWAQSTELPYYPSISPGWDATPRATLYSKFRPNRYPWSPVVTGGTPQAFGRHVKDAVEYDIQHHPPRSPLFIASWNEWSEGHYLEPDTHWETAFLEALHQNIQ